MLDIGAHHSCWLLLQALFMIARALTANSTTVVRTINNGLCIATSTTRNSEAYERQNYRGSNEPRVNATVLPKRKVLRALRTAQWPRHVRMVSVWSAIRTSHRPKFGSLRNAQIDVCEGRRRSSPQEPLSALRRLIVGGRGFHPTSSLP